MEKNLKSGWCEVFKFCFRSLVFVGVFCCSLGFGANGANEQLNIPNDRGLGERVDTSTDELLELLRSDNVSSSNDDKSISAQNNTYEVTGLTIKNQIDIFLQKKKQKNKIGWRDINGLLSGTTTGGLVKIVGGLSVILSSLALLDSPSYAVCTNSPTYDIKPDMNMSSLFSIREILDFSNQKNSTYVDGNNTY